MSHIHRERFRLLRMHWGIAASRLSLLNSTTKLSVRYQENYSCSKSSENCLSKQRHKNGVRLNLSTITENLATRFPQLESLEINCIQRQFIFNFPQSLTYFSTFSTTFNGSSGRLPIIDTLRILKIHFDPDLMFRAGDADLQATWTFRNLRSLYLFKVSAKWLPLVSRLVSWNTHLTEFSADGGDRDFLNCVCPFLGSVRHMDLFEASLVQVLSFQFPHLETLYGCILSNFSDFASLTTVTSRQGNCPQLRLILEDSLLPSSSLRKTGFGWIKEQGQGTIALNNL